MASTSSRVMRPLSPVPETPLKSTPTSRANRRIAGPAAMTSSLSWARLVLAPEADMGAAMGAAVGFGGAIGFGATGAAGAGAIVAVVCAKGTAAAGAGLGAVGLGGEAAGGAGVGAGEVGAGEVGAGEDAAAVASIVPMTCPTLTVSPSWIAMLKILPERGLGTATVALSVSSSSSDCSGLTTSPTLT